VIEDLQLSTSEMSVLQAMAVAGAVAGGFVCAELLE
jgi:hypothetical protein